MDLSIAEYLKSLLRVKVQTLAVNLGKKLKKIDVKVVNKFHFGKLKHNLNLQPFVKPHKLISDVLNQPNES